MGQQPCVGTALGKKLTEYMGRQMIGWTVEILNGDKQIVDTLEPMFVGTNTYDALGSPYTLC